ncbi:MAG TPA: ISAs1 family transposase [Gammaproteobacteria bacterium]|nr:ISAs1 family transposase [Gammaproteobacteria bacterium]
MTAGFTDHFSDLRDPRDDKNKKHQLMDILFLVIAAVISGAEGWEAIETFGQEKLEWLRKYFPYAQGVPSHDCIRMVMISLSPKALQGCFARWMQAAVEVAKGEVVAIDGKTIRRSFDHAEGLGPSHMVSAWAKRNGVSLGQVKTDEKSNEITAIPALLALLEVRGCIVTLDAMGCQREIAEQIRTQGADYVLTVKKNQRELHQAIEDYFETAQQAGYRAVQLEQLEEVDSCHGRVEVRRYALVSDLSTLPTPEQWRDLQGIARVECERHVGEHLSSEVRYYITSFGQKIERLAEAVRGHWGIENSLHWVLDVTFREDDSRLRTGYGAENFAVIRHIALNLLKREPSKGSLKRKRYKAALSNEFRSNVLFPQ